MSLIENTGVEIPSGKAPKRQSDWWVSHHVRPCYRAAHVCVDKVLKARTEWQVLVVEICYVLSFFHEIRGLWVSLQRECALSSIGNPEAPGSGPVSTGGTSPPERQNVTMGPKGEETQWQVWLYGVPISQGSPLLQRPI
jgi:hypothetical protein